MGIVGNTILVTGVSSGIGAEVAKVLAQAGAHVIGVDVVPPQVPLAQFYQCDMADPHAIDHVVAAIDHPLDALCNIAGVPGTAGASLVAKVNYLGLRHLSVALLDQLKPGGVIVNLASVAGMAWRDRNLAHAELANTPSFAAGEAWLAEHPVADDFAYPYFKEALIVWTRMMAAQWTGHHGVRINCVSPGPVETPILGEFRASLGDARVQADIDAVGRAAAVADIAPVVAFLCDPAAGWINGADIACDGGLSAIAG